jgi:GNAT superfamily N-acetyltransferase
VPCIRRALLDDAAEVARLTTELGYGASEGVISLRLSALVQQPSHFVAVAEVRPATLAGWVSAERRLILQYGERVEISALVVDSTQRRSGIGRSLIGAVEQWATECGIASLLVRSRIDRSESHAFYLSAGYVRGKTQHVYSKSLPSNSRWSGP